MNQFQNGQMLFAKGNPCFGSYCISQGLVFITKHEDDFLGEDAKFARPGELVGGEMHEVAGENAVNAVAAQDTVACFIDKKCLSRLLNSASHIQRRTLDLSARNSWPNLDSK